MAAGISGFDHGLVKTFEADADIEHGKAVKFDTADDLVIKGAAATDLLIGVSHVPGDATLAATKRVDGETVSVVLSGIAEMKAGGTITRGAWVTSDANGDAVAAAPATGVVNQVIGRALESAVDNDYFAVHILPHQIQGE